MRGLATDGGGVFCENHSAPTISWCIVIDNDVVSNGGGIYCNDSSPAIKNCRIARNIAGAGAGICCHNESNPSIINCLIYRNTAVDFSYAGGGLRCNWSSSPTVTNCTIVGNESETGAGDGVGCLNGSTPAITNCILWGNATQEIYQGGSTLAVEYCDVQGGWPGAGNIDSDPLFTADDLHLQASSPCRDAGDPNSAYTGQLDADGEIRQSDGRVDMGVDEYIDADVDALPDWWESLYFGTPTGGDPAGDVDIDGRTTAQEYVLSTNPLLPPMTYYVSVGGDDAWDGLASQWDGQHGPKATIQAALDTGHPFEGDTVLVADGTYVGRGNRDLDVQGKVISLRSANGPDNCIIDCEAAGRGFHFHNHENVATVLQGFTICNGWAVDGAGICCEFRSSPTIINCTLTENTSTGSGGGVYCSGSDPVIASCNFRDNAAFTSGGGVACSGSYAAITECTITGNTAEDGGGICFRFYEPTIRNCEITENSAVDGGGVYCSSSIASISNCLIQENTATMFGGGVYCFSNEPSLDNCTITHNVGNYGGGICCISSDAIVTDCTISDNMATWRGGGIHCSFAVPLLGDCNLAGNQAGDEGGAVSCWEGGPFLNGCTITTNRADSGGGFFLYQYSNPAVLDCTLTANWALEGRAVACDSNQQQEPSAIEIANCVLRNGGAEIANADGSTVEIIYSNVEDGWPGVGNIDSDPLFVDPDGPDDDPETWEDNDFHLAAGSPCIDSGDPSFTPELDDRDMDGQWRVWDGDGDGTWRVDMGADEFGSHCPGDLDGDGIVQLSDLAGLLSNYGTPSGATPADGDSDLDGDVDLSDLGALLSVYGESCPR